MHHVYHHSAFWKSCLWAWQLLSWYLWHLKTTSSDGNTIPPMDSFPFATRIQQTNAAKTSLPLHSRHFGMRWLAKETWLIIALESLYLFIQEIYKGKDSNPNSSRITCAWEFGFTPGIVQFIARYNRSLSTAATLRKTAVDAWIRFQLALPHTCSSCHVNGSMVWKQWAKSRSCFLFIADHCSMLRTALSFRNISWALHLQNDMPLVQV